MVPTTEATRSLSHKHPLITWKNNRHILCSCSVSQITTWSWPTYWAEIFICVPTVLVGRISLFSTLFKTNFFFTSHNVAVGSVSPLITLSNPIMAFLPQTTTPCNLLCPSPTLQALSPICCWTQPSKSLTQLSLSFYSELQPTTPPSHQHPQQPLCSSSLTNNTAYLKYVLQPIAIWNIC